MNIHDAARRGFRDRRMKLFLAMASRVPKPATLLDVGGTVDFWRDRVPAGFSLTLLNLFDQQPFDGVNVLIGDGCDLESFDANSFDIVFSNSVLCLVGSWQRNSRWQAKFEGWDAAISFRPRIAVSLSTGAHWSPSFTGCRRLRKPGASRKFRSAVTRSALIKTLLWSGLRVFVI